MKNERWTQVDWWTTLQKLKAKKADEEKKGIIGAVYKYVLFFLLFITVDNRSFVLPGLRFWATPHTTSRFGRPQNSWTSLGSASSTLISAWFTWKAQSNLCWTTGGSWRLALPGPRLHAPGAGRMWTWRTPTQMSRGMLVQAPPLSLQKEPPPRARGLWRITSPISSGKACWGIEHSAISRQRAARG